MQPEPILKRQINQSYLFCHKNKKNNTQYVPECRLGGMRNDLLVIESSSHLTLVWSIFVAEKLLDRALSSKLCLIYRRRQDF